MSQQRKLQAVIFDMDGVVVDSEPLWTEAERQLLERRHLRYSPELKAFLMGRNSPEAVSLLKKHYGLPEPVEEIIKERNSLVANLFRHSLQLVPGVLELIRSVRRAAMKTALITSSPQMLVECVLKKFAISAVFDLVLSGERVAPGKPAPNIYLKGAEKLGVLPKSCLVIEDAPSGVAAAKAAGMWCLAITTSAVAADLHQADAVVSGFAGVDAAVLENLVATAEKSRK